MKPILLVLLSVITFHSCSFYTAITYRTDRKEEYVKEDGYMFDCTADHFSYGDVLIIGTYTPETWSDDFYYHYLEGLKSDRKIKIVGVHLHPTSTPDTLTLKEVRDERIYIYQSSNLRTLIDENKQLELTMRYRENDDTVTVDTTFLLKRHKHTYPTGTFPHTF